MQVIVLGMHRSGTSAVAGVLNLMGAYVGAPDDLMAPQPGNPRGFWERSDIADLNDRVLASVDSSWWNLAGFDLSRVPKPVVEAFEIDAAKILTDLESHRPWVAKDPRFCLLLPLWRRLLDRPVCVLVYRNPVEIALSLKQRDGFSLTQGVALWEHYMVSALQSSRHDQLVLVSYHDLIADAEATTLDLHQRLRRLGVDGLAPANGHQLAAFVDPNLNHHRDIQFDSGSLLNHEQSRLARALRDGLTPRTSDDFYVSLGARDVAADLAARESVEHDARARIADLEQALAKGRQELDGQSALIRRIEEDLLASNRLRAGLEHEVSALQAQLRESSGYARKLHADLEAAAINRQTTESELTRAAEYALRLEDEVAALTDELEKAGRYTRHVEDELQTAKKAIEELECGAARLRDALAALEAWREDIEGRPLARLSHWLRRTFRTR